MTDITYELRPGHHLHLRQSGDRTTVTVTLSAPGQQQQSSTSLAIGAWTSAPQITPTDLGAMVILTTTQGQQAIEIQGTSILAASSTTAYSTSASTSQTVASPTTPLPPLQPLKMGDMEMSFQPMQMKMGNMELKMPTTPTTPKPPTATRQFCTQCGQPVQSTDRFCAHCGHALQSSHG